MIKAVKEIRKEKIAVLTNSSLLVRDDVCKDLLPTDLVAVKLDSCSQKSFEAVNHPLQGIIFEDVVCAIKNFKRVYEGKLALQVMFMQENIKFVQEIANVIREIGPDEVQINTPLRPCRAKFLSRKELDKIKKHFEGLNAISVYEAKKIGIKPISDKDTLTRRGKTG
jgi:wyosine [tRNA(Phe)-imidazoG37] synthetase (radical SAM superfamily)